jgi:hypothetical protein
MGVFESHVRQGVVTLPLSDRRQPLARWIDEQAGEADVANG